MVPNLVFPASERDHAQGSPDAQATLVEYGDYECPYCVQVYPIVKEVQKRLGPSLRFVFRNFPLRAIHPHAELAAEAAEAAAAQGRFWEMHDTIFEKQGGLDMTSLTDHAARVGADLVRWAADMKSRTFSGRVDADLRSGVRSGVKVTPTFFINGHKHSGPYDVESLLLAIESALQVRDERAYRLG